MAFFLKSNILKEMGLLPYTMVNFLPLIIHECSLILHFKEKFHLLLELKQGNHRQVSDVFGHEIKNKTT